MGGNSAVEAIGQGRVQHKDVSIENVLHIPRLYVNIILVYHMTHTGTGRKVEFTPDSMGIYDMQTNLKIAFGKVLSLHQISKAKEEIPTEVTTN